MLLEMSVGFTVLLSCCYLGSVQWLAQQRPHYFETVCPASRTVAIRVNYGYSNFERMVRYSK